MNECQIDMAVHCELVRELIETGRITSCEGLGRELGLPSSQIVASLRRLEGSHSLVLHPDRCEVWLVHPFSSSPTHTWVAGSAHGWWAPCLWCALGVATLVRGKVVVHTRIAGEAEPIEIPVHDGVPAAMPLWVHFPEPPRSAWNNVHHFCARLLPFHSPADVAAWSARHNLPLGEVLPLAQLGDLARRWYGGHARPDWRKFTIPEAAAIFRQVGLSGAFWQIEAREGAF